MMKNILNKRQMQVVMLLSAVVFIMLCGVAYTVASRRSANAVTTPANAVPKPHELVRDARPSANERLAWETNIGGSSDEKPVTMLEKNNEYYVFGNTSSSDFDFIGADQGKTRGFGARLTLGGKTLAFTVFDFSVVKVVPTSAGFAVAGNEGSTAGLYILSDTLTVTAKVSASPTDALTSCGLYIYDNRYFLVTEQRNELTGVSSLRLQIYTIGLSKEREKLFTHTNSLKFLELLPYENGYLLAAAADYQDRGYLTLARFNLLASPAYTDYDLGYKYTAVAFSPLGSGFAAVCDKDGACDLLTVDYSLRETGVSFLEREPNANSKTLFYADGAYAYTGKNLVYLSGDGKNLGNLNFSPRAVTDSCSNSVASFACGAEDGKVTVAFLGKGKSEVLSFSSVDTDTVCLLPADDGLLFAASNGGKTGDCGGHFGGSDVWIGKINY